MGGRPVYLYARAKPRSSSSRQVRLPGAVSAQCVSIVTILIKVSVGQQVKSTLILPVRKRVFVLSAFPLCLSRACLGKAITFWYKMASQKSLRVFVPHPRILDKGRCGVVRVRAEHNHTIITLLFQVAKTGSGQTHHSSTKDNCKKQYIYIYIYIYR